MIGTKEAFRLQGIIVGSQAANQNRQSQPVLTHAETNLDDQKNGNKRPGVKK